MTKSMDALYALLTASCRNRRCRALKNSAGSCRVDALFRSIWVKRQVVHGVGASSAITGDVVETSIFAVARVDRTVYFGCSWAIGTDALDDAHDGLRFP